MITATDILSILNESITIKDIDKLEKEAGAFSKNILRIKNGKELAEVWVASMRWQEYVDEFVYKRVLGATSHDYEKVKESWFTKQLGEDAWGFIVSISGMFNVSRMIYGDDGYFDVADLLRKDTRFGRVGVPVIKGNEDRWELVYKYWQKERKANYTRYGDLKRKMFKALREYMEYAEDQIDKFVTREFKIQGVPIVTHTKEGDKHQEQMLSGHTDCVKKGLALIKKKGLGRVLSGLKIEIDMQTKGSKISGVGSDMVGGYYEEKADRLVLLYFATEVSTIVHELGHRYYSQLLVEPQRKNWTEFIKKQMTWVFPEEMKSIEKAFWKGRDELVKSQGYFGSRIWKVMGKHIDSPEALVKFTMIQKHHMATMGVWSKDTEQEEAQSYIDRFKESLEGKKFMVDSISDYGNTDEKEAWAELFTNYVMGNKVPLLPLNMFKQILLGVR